MPFQKNAPQVVQFICYDGMTPTDPTNPVTTISKDSGDFVPTTNSPVVVDDGYVTVELTATEMAADTVAVRLKSDNLPPHIIDFYTEAEWGSTRAERLDVAVGTRSAAGDAMALTVGERASVALSVWANETRLLTGFGTLVSDIWSAVTRTITGGTVATVGGKTLDNLDAPISTRSTFDPATDIVKAKDHEGNPFITDEDVASGVWGAEKREVTGGTVDDISGRDLTNLDVAVGSRAVAGDAMTLTGGERSNIATAVWGATTRTLSSFGSLASDAAAAVWSAVARTITGGAVSSVGGKTLDNLDVAISTRAPSGEYDNEMAHLDADVSAVPGNVWEHDTRELTEEIDVGISESDKDDVADRVWGHTTRSLNVPIPTEISSHDRDLIAAAVGEFARLRLLIADRTLEVKAPMQIADGRGNLRLVRGDDIVLPFEWGATDVTDHTIYMTVRPHTGSDVDPTDDTATFQVVADITEGITGKFEFSISRNETEKCTPETEYWYDVQSVAPDGSITTLIIATLTVVGDVTRRAS